MLGNAVGRMSDADFFDSALISVGAGILANSPKHLMLNPQDISETAATVALRMVGVRNSKSLDQAPTREAVVSQLHDLVKSILCSDVSAEQLRKSIASSCALLAEFGI
ncbi:hypothetical protein [Undibacterium crateris]|uniref:hypothetical protein n=1 Tax=Undibacterium crateris TaxID=2528175 RepID=UPI0013897C96|nr:hypothetical protein [Undibacterium crateris]NDI85104.1 hypothetical protein [Undibacterium crateris]